MREEVGFQGELVWDASKPDGQEAKIFDVRRLRAQARLRDHAPRGLRRTYTWLERHYDDPGDGLRL
jgi:hypothetical protein